MRLYPSYQKRNPLNYEIISILCLDMLNVAGRWYQSHLYLRQINGRIRRLIGLQSEHFPLVCTRRGSRMGLQYMAITRTL